MTPTDLAPLRRLVSDACRILAARGLDDGILGHVSLRVTEGTRLVRCRGPHERGLLHTSPTDIHPRRPRRSPGRAR